MEERKSHLGIKICAREKKSNVEKVSGGKFWEKMVGWKKCCQQENVNQIKLRNVTVKNRSPKSEFWPVVNFGEKWNVTIGKILVEWWEKIIFVHTLGQVAGITSQRITKPAFHHHLLVNCKVVATKLRKQEEIHQKVENEERTEQPNYPAIEQTCRAPRN